MIHPHFCGSHYFKNGLSGSFFKRDDLRSVLNALSNNNSAIVKKDRASAVHTISREHLR